MKKMPENEKTVEIASTRGSPWTYQGFILENVPEKAVGFVYLIRHTPSGKGYIGRKLFFFKKEKQVKGKKKKVLAESDWRQYWSSSDLIQQMVEEQGESAFTREILHIAYNKGSLNYLEAREQMDRRVLENPSMWLNRNIMCKIHLSHVKLDPPSSKTSKK